jgi:hypothetical protein
MCHSRDRRGRRACIALCRRVSAQCEPNRDQPIPPSAPALHPRGPYDTRPTQSSSVHRRDASSYLDHMESSGFSLPSLFILPVSHPLYISPFVCAPALFVVVPIHCCYCISHSASSTRRFLPIYPTRRNPPLHTIHISDRIFAAPSSLLYIGGFTLTPPTLVKVPEAIWPYVASIRSLLCPDMFLPRSFRY